MWVEIWTLHFLVPTLLLSLNSILVEEITRKDPGKAVSEDNMLKILVVLMHWALGLWWGSQHGKCGHWIRKKARGCDGRKTRRLLFCTSSGYWLEPSEELGQRAGGVLLLWSWARCGLVDHYLSSGSARQFEEVLVAWGDNPVTGEDCFCLGVLSSWVVCPRKAVSWIPRWLQI